MHSRLRGAYIYLSSVACRAAGVYEYLLPRHVTSIVRETIRRPQNYCSKKLHLQSYLEMLWSKTGYFGLLGNNIIFVIILLDLIER